MSQGLGAVTASRIKGARLSVYQATGHAASAEATARFDTELAAFCAAIPQ